MARIRTYTGFDTVTFPATTPIGAGTFYPWDPRTMLDPKLALDLSALLLYRAWRMKQTHSFHCSGTGVGAGALTWVADLVGESVMYPPVGLVARNSEWTFARPQEPDSLLIPPEQYYWSTDTPAETTHLITYNPGAIAQDYTGGIGLFEIGSGGVVGILGARRGFWNTPNLFFPFRIQGEVGAPTPAPAGGAMEDGPLIEGFIFYSVIEGLPFATKSVGSLKVTWPAHWLGNASVSLATPLYVCDQLDAASGGGAPTRTITASIDITITQCHRYGLDPKHLDLESPLNPVWADNGSALLDPLVAADHTGQ